MQTVFIIFGYLLGTVVVLLMLIAFVPSEEGTSPEDAREETISCLVIGAIAATAGGGLAWSNDKKKVASTSDMQDS